MSNYYIVPSDYSLSHSGIQGMKWGIRRYQNEDGSLTEEGRMRYAKHEARKYYKIAKLKRKQEKTNSFKKYRKIDAKIRRREEKEERAGTKANLTKDEIRKGRAIISRARLTGTSIAMAATGTALTAGLLAASAATPVALIGGAVGAGIAAHNGHFEMYRRESRAYRVGQKHNGGNK